MMNGVCRVEVIDNMRTLGGGSRMCYVIVTGDPDDRIEERVACAVAVSGPDFQARLGAAILNCMDLSLRSKARL